MSTDLEDEMRRALFGNSNTAALAPESATQKKAPVITSQPGANTVSKKKRTRTFTPRLKVIMLVGNEYEGETREMVHEADTLSTLLAQQEAMRAARKKFKYVKILSVESM